MFVLWVFVLWVFVLGVFVLGGVCSAILESDSIQCTLAISVYLLINFKLPIYYIFAKDSRYA